jgi:hypothetical protein
MDLLFIESGTRENKAAMVEEQEGKKEQSFVLQERGEE